MTTLTILPNYDKKKLKFFGTIAAGEHVAVTVTDGAQWLGSGSALRLRVLFGPTTVGVFPAADADEWTATGTQDADAYCELNLNTVQAEKLLKFGGTCLWILDDIENHTLYATGEFDVLPWPKRRGIDEPIDLDDYPQLVEDMEDLKEAWIAYQATIAQSLAAKQDVISDLANIRSGASAGATAVQPSAIMDGGKIKSDLLPSYVDDVVEYDAKSLSDLPAFDTTKEYAVGDAVKYGVTPAAYVFTSAHSAGAWNSEEVRDGTLFPATGESGKIYVALDTNKTYRWSGTTYVEIAGTPTLDDAVTRTSANGVKSSGIWAAIWGALTALPTGFSSLYDWVVAQLSGKASTADATLTERGFSAWQFPGFPEIDEYSEKNLVPYEYSQGIVLEYRVRDKDWETGEWGDWYVLSSSNNNAPLDATSFTWLIDLGGEEPASFTGTRTALPGYQLGAQSDKPLASEAEAEALRQGKAAKPATSTNNNLAALDANGNLKDSGKKPSDFATAEQGAKADAPISPASSSLSGDVLSFSAAYRNGGLLVLGQFPSWYAHGLKANDSAIAPEFDASASYAVGDIVMFNGARYKCVAAHSGAWAAADFTAESVQTAIESGGGSAGGIPSDAHYVYVNSQGQICYNPDQTGGGGGQYPSGTSLSFAIAPEFSTSATYAVGDVVMYAGLRYVCSTAVTTAGAWTGSANWTEQTVQDVIGDVESILHTINNGSAS